MRNALTGCMRSTHAGDAHAFPASIHRSFCLTVMRHQAHATRPDETEQRILPAPATVFGIVTPAPFVRIATAPTGIPSPVYWARSYVLSPIRVSRVPVPESTDNMPNDTKDRSRNTWQPRPPPAYARPLLASRLPGPPLAAEASETHIDEYAQPARGRPTSYPGVGTSTSSPCLAA